MADFDYYLIIFDNLKIITKIRLPFFADFLQYLLKYWAEIRENQSGIYLKTILSIRIKFS